MAELIQNIKMVDLKSQYLNIKTEVDDAISAVIESTQFIGGPVLNEFTSALENKLGVNHVIPCANGTDALQVALMALDLKPEAEPVRLVEKANSYELSGSGKHLLVRKGSKIYVIAASSGKDVKLDEKKEVQLGGLRFAVDKRAVDTAQISND